jgi:hypothetical protein
MKFASTILSAALAIVAFAAPARAQQFVAGEIKKSVVTADLAAVVGALGHQVLEQGDTDKVLVVAQMPLVQEEQSQLQIELEKQKLQ